MTTTKALEKMKERKRTIKKDDEVHVPTKSDERMDGVYGRFVLFIIPCTAKAEIFGRIIK